MTASPGSEDAGLVLSAEDVWHWCPIHCLADACRRDPAKANALAVATPACWCPPCTGRGYDGHRMNHCAECCFGSGVVADEWCSVHGRDALAARTPPGDCRCGADGMPTTHPCGAKCEHG